MGIYDKINNSESAAQKWINSTQRAVQNLTNAPSVSVGALNVKHDMFEITLELSSINTPASVSGGVSYLTSSRQAVWVDFSEARVDTKMFGLPFIRFRAQWPIFDGDAPKRLVRASAWLSSAKYHDGGVWRNLDEKRDADAARATIMESFHAMGWR